MRILPMRSRGRDARATVTGAPVRLRQWKHSTRTTVIVEIPAARLGRARLASGERVSLDATLFAQGGYDADRWRQDLTLSALVWDALRRIEICASYIPSKTHPLHGWWMAASSSP